jgi:hypothetical protein
LGGTVWASNWLVIGVEIPFMRPAGLEPVREPGIDLAL